MSDITRFQAPRPTFRATTNPHAAEAMTPGVKDTTPSPSVIQRTEANGDLALAKLLADSQVAAKASAKVIESSKRPRTPRQSLGESSTSASNVDNGKTSGASGNKTASSKFQSDDVVDDTTFIQRTRVDIHSPEVQALFWANGGERHMVAGLTYAQAFENLRREKMQLIKHPKPSPTAYSRHTSLPQGKVITPGIPTSEERTLQLEAASQARRLISNERWAGIKNDK